MSFRRLTSLSFRIYSYGQYFVQASDFFWERESGLRVNVGIMDVHLIPEYEDVEHESDNKYMLSNPNNNEDKAKYQNVLQNFCRSAFIAWTDYVNITLTPTTTRTRQSTRTSSRTSAGQPSYYGLIT